MDFEWDAAKATANRRKHGVLFGESATVFVDPFAIRVFDELHSSDSEERWILLGRSIRNRVLHVVFVEIGMAMIRIISARKATINERKGYEGNQRRLGGC